MNSGMTLAVFTGQYFRFDGKHYSTDEAFVKFVMSFHAHFEKIVFCDVVKGNGKSLAYRLDPSNTQVCPLPYFSLNSLWKNMLIVFPEVYRRVRHNIHRWDIVWLHAPHPVGLLLACMCKRLHKPFFLFIRQNLRVYVAHRNRGARRRLAALAAAFLECIFGLLFRKTLTLAVGKDLFAIQKRRRKWVYPVEVSLVSEKDIVRKVRNRIPEKRGHCRLLYVGRLDPEKGVVHLIQALRLLIDNGKTDATLRLVGTGREAETLRRQIDQLGLDQHVVFLGYVKHGTELFDTYKESDIFVLPSLTEGCPQVLFEAMACGVPIVATSVGGVPYLIKDGENGLLVRSGSSREIFGAVKRLMNDPRLGNRLAKKGIATVRNHTIELKTEQMIVYLERLCPA